MIHGAVLLLWLSVCAVQDFRQRHIANGLTLGAALLALLYVVWTGCTWLGAPAGEGAWALGLALLLTLPGYALGRFGAGDVKLLAALGLATTVNHLLWSLILAAALLAAWSLVHQGLGARHETATRRTSRKQPFAPFVLTGFALYWFWIH
ncbi:prepilin peptidase [Pseudomonas sp. LG1E9]|uniref:prepilin peptidase n=1 Tax=Pseudomonas sp. LG1E9 TaxID=2219057 RepID=UPI000DD4D0F2|nr:prepilin peptidase [Pseudomonas sp. LG1E9]